MWIKVNESYLQYMKDLGDSRIPDQDYGEGRYKPFFRLFKIGDLSYITQINHAQRRHQRMNEMEDFYKLSHNGRLVGVVNLNYMFPVLDKHIEDVSYVEIRDILEKGDRAHEIDAYIEMLESEGIEIEFKNIPLKANILYEKQQSNEMSQKLFNRCLNYKELEKTMLQYELDKVFEQEDTKVLSSHGMFFVEVDEQRYTVTYNDLKSIEALKEVHEYSLELSKEMTNDNSYERSM